MNKWRMVKETDDGCCLYQCLKCKAKWESRSYPGGWCSYCGTEWEGERPYKEGGPRFPPPSRPPSVWVIQGKLINWAEEFPWADTVHVYDTRTVNAALVYRILKDLDDRDLDSARTRSRYRAIIRPPNKTELEQFGIYEQ